MLLKAFWLRILNFKKDNMDDKADQEVNKEVIITYKSEPPSLLVVMIVAAFFSVMSSGITWYLISSKQLNYAGPVVALDATKLTTAAMNSLYIQGKSDGNPQDAAKAFAENLEKTLSQYSSNGILVINSAAVLNRPSGVDITGKVISQMGFSGAK